MKKKTKISFGLLLLFFLSFAFFYPHLGSVLSTNTNLLSNHQYELAPHSSFQESSTLALENEQETQPYWWQRWSNAKWVSTVSTSSTNITAPRKLLSPQTYEDSNLYKYTNA